MADTKDLIGDKNTVEAIITDELADFEDDDVKSIAEYKFYRKKTLTSVIMPNVTTIGRYAFQECPNLKSVQIPKVTAIPYNCFYNDMSLESADISATTAIESYAFYRCNNLRTLLYTSFESVGTQGFFRCEKLNEIRLSKETAPLYIDFGCYMYSGISHLIIDCPFVSSPSNTTYFASTRFKWGIGAIYVPVELLDDYKTSSAWSNYSDCIHSMDEYPISDFSTISDTWEEIFEAEDNGTYSSKYSIGDTKSLMIGDTLYYVQIVAFDADDLADGTGKAKITWMLKFTLSDKYAMNSANSYAGGWSVSDLRDNLQNVIINTIQAEVRNRIKRVVKTSAVGYSSNTSMATETSVDTLWCLSLREVNGVKFNNRAGAIEDSGPIYSDFFTVNGNSALEQRVSRDMFADATSYCLRTSSHPNDSMRPISVSTTGAISMASPSTAYNCLFGFCT